MLRAMQNEAGRQIVRGLTADDGALPAQLRDGPPTAGELREAHNRAVMLYDYAPPVGAAVGAIGATVFLFAKVKGVGVLAAAAPLLAVVAGASVVLWGASRLLER
jgi:hypothetical protein